MIHATRELIWDPTPDPDDAHRIKRGDAYCYAQRSDAGPACIKEYPYAPPIIQRYHDIQNLVAQHLGEVGIGGYNFSFLELPCVANCQVDSQSDFTGCAVSIPYIEGAYFQHGDILTQLLEHMKKSMPGIIFQRLQGSNCKQQPDDSIIITDIAWDIPTFLRDNPSGDAELDRVILGVQRQWSQIIYDVYPFARDK